MKNAVILAGGKGVRLAPSTIDMPKPMVKVNGRPILEYVLRLVKDIGCTDVTMIVGYKQELIREYFGAGHAFGVKLEYLDNTLINSQARSGLSDAILLLEGRVTEPFLTILGDEIYVDTRHDGMVKEFERAGSDECMIAVHETGDREAIKKNYSVCVDSAWRVGSMEEKPSCPPNNLLGCGTYIFRPSVFEYIRKTPLSPKSGRKELADTMMAMVNDGKTVRAFPIKGKYLNINYPEDLQNAQKYLEGSR